MTDLPLLSLVIWLPIIGGMIVLAAHKASDNLVRWMSLAISILVFLVSIPLYTLFDTATHEMQFTETASWIPAFNISYALGVDGISMPLILLTTFFTVIVVIAGWEVIKTRVALYMASFLIMEGMMNGVFAALDGILFYIFWEAMLVPMFLIIGIWGGADRIYATIKFFLYTFLGSVLLLISLIYLYFQVGNFSILAFQDVQIGMTAQILIFLAMLLAFAVKVPMWPVHTWLPDAHVQAPTGGSIILAAIMLKLGAYGFVRFMIPIAPDASQELDWLIISLSLIAVIYISFVAIVQEDMKKLIAYSSIAHMGFATLGFFLVYGILENTGSTQGAALGIEGGLVQLISHGFISGAMFFCIGIMYDRMHSRRISDYGGVVNTMPVFAAFFVLFAMANTGLPGTSGFVGEFMVILSAFQSNFWIAFLATTTLIFGAAYTLWLIKRVIFGEVANDDVAVLKDVNKREILILGVLAFFVLALGVYPDPLVEVMHSSVDHLVQQAVTSKL